VNNEQKYPPPQRKNAHNKISKFAKEQTCRCLGVRRLIEQNLKDRGVAPELSTDPPEGINGPPNLKEALRKGSRSHYKNFVRTRHKRGGIRMKGVAGKQKGKKSSGGRETSMLNRALPRGDFR